MIILGKEKVNSVFEEIAGRIDYTALYSEYIRVRRRGSRLTALCPFHTEKSPSFSIDVRTGLWHCFGCKEGGNVFQFIQKIENLEMGEVVELLARKYGVDLSKFQGRVEKEKLTKRQYYLKILSAVAKFYTDELFGTTHGQQALKYLKERGLTESTIKRYRIGVTPRDSNGLTQALLERNVRRETLELLGICVTGRGQTTPDAGIDFFRNRIIFPLFNLRGEIVSFAGRSLTDEEPKYLNTTNTVLYSKSRLLYGMNYAKNAISEKGEVLVVEGYMDVIALHQAGILNAVATCGTALTSEHIRQLGRYADGFMLAFDGDSAGVKAAIRAGEECLAVGYFPKIILFRDGKDPAELIKEGGKSAFEKALGFGVTTSLPRLLVGLRIKGEETNERTLRALISEARQIYRRISDPITAGEFTRELADALKLTQKAVSDILGAYSVLSGSSSSITVSDALGRPEDQLYKNFFSALIVNPTFLGKARMELTEEDFPKGIFRSAWNAVISEGFSVSTNVAEPLRKFFAQIATSKGTAKDFTIDSYIERIKKLRLTTLSERILRKRRELTRAVESQDTALASSLEEEIKSLLARQKELRESLVHFKNITTPGEPSQRPT